MRASLGTTLKRLKAISPQLPDTATHRTRSSGRLTPFERFGSNPGDLKAFTYLPAASAPRPLVVVLHGCTQTAAGYDQGSGWSQLAQQHGFGLLFPEQQRSNNPNLCFNWFNPADMRRGRGEALSIQQMITALIERGEADATRIFVTGLSAGGAMTSVLLATYPELFAGGAIIAGLPFGTAKSVPEALERMRGQGQIGNEQAAQLVRRASPYSGPWPTISVWHGTADTTVVPSNADAIIGQWSTLHGVGEQPDARNQVDGFPHRVWRNAQGKTVIEEYEVTGMGHGTPLDADGSKGLGVAMAHMLNVGISSTRRIAAGWGLLEGKAVTVPAARPRPADRKSHSAAPKLPVPHGIQTTIETALRAAGLMR